MAGRFGVCNGTCFCLPDLDLTWSWTQHTLKGEDLFQPKRALSTLTAKARQYKDCFYCQINYTKDNLPRSPIKTLVSSTWDIHNSFHIKEKKIPQIFYKCSTWASACSTWATCINRRQLPFWSVDASWCSLSIIIEILQVSCWVLIKSILMSNEPLDLSSFSLSLSHEVWQPLYVTITKRKTHL